jgi:hypothetical protein
MPPDFSVVAIVAAYNEADIVEHVIRDLVDQGVQVYFLDDGSTDGTTAIVERSLGRGVIGIERLAGTVQDGEPAGFEWERILLRKTQLATELDADWFIHHDADEFRESPWPHLSLHDAIRRVDALGFNAIDFAGLDFRPVQDGFPAGADVREALTFYSDPAPYDRIQIRCWKKASDLDLASSAGHEARFHGRKVFPLRFILRHYPIRGQAHGERKVFQERRQRFLERERARGWHVQYDAVREGGSFICHPSTLTPYDPDGVRLALTLRHRGVEELEASLADVRSVVETLEASLGGVRSVVETQRLDLERSHAELERSHDELARTRAELGDALEKKMAELAESRAETAALREALEQRAEEIEKRAEEIGHLRDVIDDRTRRLDDRTRRVDDLLGSLSWRCTSPARAAYRLFTGALGRGR